MTTPSLSPEALSLYRLIHRGGEHAYLWGKTCDPQSNGITRWFRPGERPAAFNSNHNNYHGVHPTTKAGNRYQRAKKGERDIAVVNCLYADEDDKDHGGAAGAAHAYLEGRIASGPVPRPTVTVGSGGGVQPYWGLREPFVLDTEEKRERADRIQKRWVAFVGADDGAKDAARVLRVPGTLNFKYDPPRPVTIIEADYTRLYTLDELEVLLPPEPAPKERATRQKTADAPRPVGSASDHDFDTIADAARNLGRLAAWRRDAYPDWIAVGMALRELGSIGYELWEKWSKLSSKYQPGDCEAHWRTFKPGDECASARGGITLASLARWAHEDAPEAETPAVPEQVQRELTDLRQRVTWEQKILNCKGLKPTEKGVLVGLYDIIAAHRHLGGNDGRIPLDYDYAAKVLSTSKTTVGNVVDVGEKVGLWRKDPETVASDDGYEIKRMRLELQPAYDAPPKQADLDRPKHGGARPGAGRKPKCTECPPGTVHRMVTKRTVSYHCAVHGLIKEETLPDLIGDYVPDGIQDETGEENVATSVSSFAPPPEADAGIQDETGSVEEQRTLAPLADKKHSGQPEAPIIGPTRIGDAIVNLSYIENRLKAGDLSAIALHCQLAGVDYGAVIAEAQALPAGGAS